MGRKAQRKYGTHTQWNVIPTVKMNEISSPWLHGYRALQRVNEQDRERERWLLSLCVWQLRRLISGSWAWFPMPVTPAARRLSQEYHELKVILNDVTRKGQGMKGKEGRRVSGKIKIY